VQHTETQYITDCQPDELLAHSLPINELIAKCTATHYNTLQTLLHTATQCSTLCRFNANQIKCMPMDMLIVLQCVAVCCSVLQCVAVCCSVLQCVAVCCIVLQCIANQMKCLTMNSSMNSSVAVCRSVSQCVAVCCSVLQCVAVCCSVL